MSKKILIRSRSSCNRRQPLLQRSNSCRRTRTRLGEAVGGTAAVCCCCPAVVANVMILAIYKVPASLCRRAMEKKKKHKQKRLRNLHSTVEKEGLVQNKRSCTCGCRDDISIRGYPKCDNVDDIANARSQTVVEQEEEKEVIELEEEMWARFSTTGFWRSPSQRDSTSSQEPIIGSVSVPNLQVLAA
ncbi:hypothetical protein Lal_00039712 [Lupinus albus]|uniref:Uncharacterized protein n=1 Tax=Lupinus albus TaxID=3870 RepID=A0A6A4QFM8_LUPAL|nr:hypothetical protein Lalb_Chr06g0172901 [Lupinus albus]KAF1879768.1 hypothetical protein Lal_00039712 [Lupinus albus]